MRFVGCAEHVVPAYMRSIGCTLRRVILIAFAARAQVYSAMWSAAHSFGCALHRVVLMAFPACLHAILSQPALHAPSTPILSCLPPQATRELARARGRTSIGPQYKQPECHEVLQLGIFGIFGYFGIFGRAVLYFWKNWSCGFELLEYALRGPCRASNHHPGATTHGAPPSWPSRVARVLVPLVAA